MEEVVTLFGVHL